MSSTARNAWFYSIAVIASLVPPTQGEQPKTVVPAEHKGTEKLHQDYVAKARQGGVDLLFLGDSITQAWRGQPAWSEYFAPLHAAQFGVGGDRTQHVLWRIEHGELDGINPKVIVLMIGTNNMRDDKPGDIALGVRAIVDEIKQRKPESRILLLAIFPRGQKPTDPVRTKVRETNQIIAALDDAGRHVRYMDIGAKFLEPDGTILKSIMPDYLHLTKEGYRRWAEAVMPAIKDMLHEAGR